MSDAMVSSTELAAMSGASYRQVHYWTESGYLKPSGSKRNGGQVAGPGSKRLYPLADVLRARLLRELLDPVLMAQAAIALADDKVADLPGGFTIQLSSWTSARPALSDTG